MEFAMADETRTPQTDPPEGSRKVIEHELERQEAKERSGSGQQDEAAETGSGKSEVTQSRH